MSQAQTDFEQLRVAKVEVVRKEDPLANDAPLGVEEKVAGPQATGAASILDRLAGTPIHHTVSVVRSTLTSNTGSSNANQLRRMAENFRTSAAGQRIQLSLQQAEALAEDYMRKGDVFLKDAEKWMEDAVKIVPPEELEGGMSWDGSDWYSFSTSTSHASSSRTVLYDAGSDGVTKPNRRTTMLAGSRKAALLRRLREDKALLLVDPEGVDETPARKADYRTWLAEHWPEQLQSRRSAEEGHVGGLRMDLGG